jgi:hypothetical protein
MFALHLSGFRVLSFNCTSLKTVAKAEQKASSLAGCLLRRWLCVSANMLALWRWLNGFAFAILDWAKFNLL